ncbi:hypothetical protein TRFO_12643 [Tritrichomonas foetus]|uniref:Tubby C-terminal domain-containing protein n=1 Tax=Tritrichomonas foetus TaxID=1144522 RepID=A0A1J4L219_9EUKA|nr:hypothetical protein TRFO_12643 [Tritrichomonas foetus]|eukprot:OHT17120.1 hypothetical protein TRFO_12643 [Tritrichomonas foetus]
MRPTIVFSSSSYASDDEVEIKKAASSKRETQKKQQVKISLDQETDSFSYSDNFIVIPQGKPKTATLPQKQGTTKTNSSINKSRNTGKINIKIESDNDESDSGNYSRSSNTEKDDKNITEKSEPKMKIKPAHNSELNDDDDLPPIVLVNNQANTIPQVTFAVSRKIKSSIRGKRFYYYFYSDSNPLFCAKAKSRHPTSHIPICKGDQIHMKGKHEYTFLVGNDSTFFSLRKGKSSGDELLAMNIVLDSSLLMLPRHIDVQIFEKIGIPPISLTTKRPKMSTRGDWTLDFHNKFTIPSEKNAIFVLLNDKEGPDLLVTRKISGSGMEIDLCTNLPEIAVFAIGLGIFIAKLR